LAYALCGISVDWCRSLGDWVGGSDTLSASLRAKADVLARGDPVLASSMNFCLGVTAVNLVPLIVLLMLGASSVLYLAYLPCVMAPRLLAVVAQALAFTHAHEG
jgi:hypothetical protein